jgi:hypothetical protein
MEEIFIFKEGETNNMNQKILFIIPTLAEGGAEKVVSVLSNHLKDYKKDVVFFENKIDIEWMER